MALMANVGNESLAIARRWCKIKGHGWSVQNELGTGGTAPVFEVVSPQGIRALKIYDVKFSVGEKGEIEHKRIDQQLALKGHNCPFLVQVYEGARFEDRLYLLMSRADGKELEKRLKDIPRNKIRQILDQVTRAAIFLKSKGLCHRDIKAANIFISDDCERCTLLDISVIRNVSDPIGVGTDHDGQLPVVATARYSPPEYLFRLLEPSAELWHALNVYQLGALLHDLIMREPLFEREYAESAENRYRFAWVIATSNAPLQAEDVDRDLLLTARLALDKNWRRRSALQLEDFLSDSSVQQRHALNAIGLGVFRKPAEVDDNIATRLQRIHRVSSTLEQAIASHLRSNGATTKHTLQPGPDDDSKTIQFNWDAPAREPGDASLPVKLRIDLRLSTDMAGYCFGLSITLTLESEAKASSLDLPELQDGPDVEIGLLTHVVDALEKLAIEIIRGGVVGMETRQ